MLALLQFPAGEDIAKVAEDLHAQPGDLVHQSAKGAEEIAIAAGALHGVEGAAQSAVGFAHLRARGGGAGQYGDVWVRFEPCDSEDMVFAEEVFGGAVPKQFFPPTEQGLRDCMKHGPLAGFKVVGVKATLYDGSYHPVDSKEVAFKEAARLAYNAAMPKANPVLLEPIGKAVITVPEAYTGTIMGDLTKRRGMILDMTTNEYGDQVITAEVPMAEMLTYAIDLRAMSQGRGSYIMDFDRYQQAPKDVEAKVVAQAKAKKEAEQK